MTMGEMATSFLSSELGVNVNYRAGSNKNSALVQHAYLTQSHVRPVPHQPVAVLTGP